MGWLTHRGSHVPIVQGQALRRYLLLLEIHFCTARGLVFLVVENRGVDVSELLKQLRLM